MKNETKAASLILASELAAAKIKDAITKAIFDRKCKQLTLF